MFIIERRTAGVLAALAMTAAMVVLSNMGETADANVAPTATNSTTPLEATTGRGAGSNALADARQTPQYKRDTAESR